MPKKRKHVSLVADPYTTQIFGLINFTHEEARAWLKKYYNYEDTGTTPGWCLGFTCGGAHNVVIFLEKLSKKPKDLALLAHECIHATFFILKHHGQGVDTTDHEHFTYLYQSIFQRLLEKHARQN